jgi:diaminohydroxyphosphoribosylaminopyrimidine deaminase/5-amino-6-(5-phosphoribosylamino)uracil reductase
MKLAGIDVKVGVLEKESIELNKAFFTFHNKKRPYVLLKWAQTLDGFIDVDRNSEINSDNWISNKFSKQMVHLLRSKIDGILVGKNTARNDNPSLTTRLVSGKSPTRLIIDFDASLPDNLIIFNGQTPTIVFTSKTKPNKTNLTYVKVQNRKSIISEILNYCFNNNIQTLMVEGGAQTLNLFIENNLWDEAHVFIGEKTFGTGIKAPQITKVKPKIFSFFNDKLLLYKNE